MRNLSEVFSKFDGVQTKGMNRKGGMYEIEDWYAWQTRSQAYECIVAVPSATTFEEAVAHLKAQVRAHGVQGEMTYDNNTKSEDFFHPYDCYGYDRWEEELVPNPDEPTWVHVQRGRVF